MAAAVDAKFHCMLEVEETLELSLNFPTDPTFTHVINLATAVIKGTLNASSTVPATKVFSDNLVLAGGDQTLDLTALTGAASTTVNFTDLKVQLVALAASTSNATAVTVTGGAANPYNILGETNATSDKISIPPGGSLVLYHHDGTEDVSGTKKNVRFQGGVNENINIILVAG